MITFLTPETVVWRYLRCPQRQKQARIGAKTPFFATERPNFERRYLGQFSILGELFGGAVGKQYKVTPPTPKTVVWRYLRYLRPR